jgi:hypothetical protein
MTGEQNILSLTPIEQKLARYVGAARYNAARAAKVTNARVGGQSNEQTDVEGFAAELAFSRLVNVYPDLTIGARHGGFDCELNEYFGIRVDVKATRYRSGRLLATRGKFDVSDVDVYALMVGEMPTYRFVGWATKEELIQQANLSDLGRGVGYVLPQARLHRELLR